MSTNETEVTSVTCSNCGSSDVDMLTERTGKCRHCGATITIERNEPGEKTTIIHAIDTKKGKKEVDVLVAESETSEDDFLRDAYLFLFADKSIPESIGDAEFLPVIKETSQFAKVSGNYHFTYSAQIGHDRVEQYVVQETKYDKDLGRNVTKNVVKERTVTDWSPMSGTKDYSDIGVEKIAPETESVVKNDDETLFSLLLRRGEYKDPVPYEDSKIKEKVAVSTESDWKRAEKEPVIRLASDIKYGLGGDHIKNFSHSNTFELEKREIILAEKYTLPFKFKNNSYFVDSYGFVPYVNKNFAPKGEKDDSELKLEAEHKEKLKKNLLFNFLIILAPTLALIIIGAIFQNVGSGGFGRFLSIIAMPWAIFSVVFFAIVKRKKLKEQLNNEKKAFDKLKQQKKKEKLNEIFKEKGLHELIKEEEAIFERG